MSNRLELRLIGLITFINAAVGVVVGALLYDFAPEHYFKWYPSIPVFYWLMAIAMAFFLNMVKKKKGDVTVTTYMVVRFCKFTLALVFMWLYATLIGEHLRTFGFTLMLFYFIYLGMETYTLYLYEKKRMNREKREQNESNNK